MSKFYNTEKLLDIDKKYNNIMSNRQIRYVSVTLMINGVQTSVTCDRIALENILIKHSDYDGLERYVSVRCGYLWDKKLVMQPPERFSFKTWLLIQLSKGCYYPIDEIMNAFKEFKQNVNLVD